MQYLSSPSGLLQSVKFVAHVKFTALSLYVRSATSLKFYNLPHLVRSAARFSGLPHFIKVYRHIQFSTFYRITANKQVW